MFEKENRYITRAVLDVVPIEINLLLYDLIDELTIEKDYLQIFELNLIGNDIVEIIHKQEVPNYECSIYICNKKLKEKLKLYAVDSIEYSTLMFSYEY